MIRLGGKSVRERAPGGGIAAQVRAFISANFLFDSGELDDGQSLIDGGIIDSTGVVELVAFLEQTFGIEIGDEDLVPENLDSVARIAAFVAARREG